VTFGRLSSLTILGAVAGLSVSGYLTGAHYADVAPVCAGGGDGCRRVQSSPYAELAGVPVALLGAGGYAAILLAASLRGEGARLAAAGLSIAGLGFSGYLTYVELVIIEAVCQWCVVSAALMAVLAALSVARVLAAPDDR